MSKKTKHNPERKSWKGKSYKKGGKRIRDEREKISGYGNCNPLKEV